jgi:hypothetical protein
MKYVLTAIIAALLFVSPASALGVGSNLQISNPFAIGKGKTYQVRHAYKRGIRRSVSRKNARIKHIHQHRHRGATASIACLTPQTQRTWYALKARVSDVKAISTCVVKKIAGTNRPSFHSFGMAVDFTTRHKATAIAFLRSQGVFVMTYCNMGHVHFNHGQSGYSGCGVKTYRGIYAKRKKHAVTARRR